MRPAIESLGNLRTELEDILANLEDRFAATERFAAIQDAVEALSAIDEVDLDQIEGINWSW